MTRREVLALGGGALVLTAVGGPAAVASYRHAWTVVERSGDPAMAPWLPATTDGLLVAALVVMWVRRFVDRPIGRGPWAAFALGLFATLWANVRAVGYLSTDAERIAVALWGPVALAVTLELLALLVADARGGPVRIGDSDPDRSAADRTGEPIGRPDRTDELGSDRYDREPIDVVLGPTELVEVPWEPPLPDPVAELGPNEPDWQIADAERLAQSGRLEQDPRLTPADLLIVEQIEAGLSPGDPRPSIYSTRRTFGLGKDRADRILAAVRLPEGSDR